MDDEYAIGLDLGTTFSCIGVYKDGKVEIIPNKKDEKTTPSIVIIDKFLDVQVGEDTEENLVKNYNTCIYEIKRFIGRKFSDKEVQKELEKLPYKMIGSQDDDSPCIQITSNNIPILFNPVEISSFIIKKMVQIAEKYINKKVTKLVITVPAYFSDSQRKLTKQAAELAGLNVLRVINEPTAAALAYGFDKKQALNKKILVFDLGGGTFDVSILSVNKDENNSERKIFQVLGTSGDTQLGGEDFDNKLVEFCLDQQNNKEDIMKDKQCLKKLKINCESIKRKLSYSNEQTLFIEKFFKFEDLKIKIKREEFEDICNDLFIKLVKSLDDALINAKLTKDEINEIILIGGSTRMPKVKKILKIYFPNCIINDSINPDEAVAFGATIEAEKILHNNSESISNFLLKDITPLSLGTNILNKSTNPKIRGEGKIMDVIIKRGTPIPYTSSQLYSTVYDNQTEMVIDIYEGENTFIKYNHLLKKSKINGLKKKPKGKTRVLVTFEIDINGILTVNAKEKSEKNDGQSMEPIIIKNDDISLTPDKMEKLKEKNKLLLEKIKNNDLAPRVDYTNLKKTLKDYKDAYIKCKNEQKEKLIKYNEEDEEEEEDESLIYITNFNNTLEEFIDSFDIEHNFDNETVIEKYYLYIRELFLSYIETLKIKSLGERDKKQIIKNIEKYIDKFINKNSDYLNNLLETLNNGLVEDTKKNEKIKLNFYAIVIYVIEKLNEYGNEYIQSNKQYCKYYSLLSYEHANTIYEKYLSKVNIDLLAKKDKENLEKQKSITTEKIKDITNGAIVLCYESLKGGYLIDCMENREPGRNLGNHKLCINDIIKTIEIYKIVLNNYEKILSEIQNSEKIKNTIKEAICIANIIKISYIFGEINLKKRTLLRYAERCKYIINANEDQEQFKEKYWYKEFEKLYKNLKDLEPRYEEYYRILPEIKDQYSDIFNEIERRFNKKKSNYDFIKFILENHPYKDYEKDKENTILKTYSIELVNFLLEKYNPDDYSLTEDLTTQLQYCIIHEIAKKLNNIYTTP